MDLDDDGKLRMRYVNKRVNAEKEGIGFGLTYDDFKRLMRRAKIVSSQLGIRGYHLSRKGDVGDYVVGNCRFLWYKKNYAEKYKRLGQVAGGRYKHITWEEHVARKKLAADLTAEIKYTLAHESYRGENNSQFGSFWITNGTVNKKWRPENGSLPRGFKRGRSY
jgi:hypothetical protein